MTTLQGIATLLGIEASKVTGKDPVYIAKRMGIIRELGPILNAYVAGQAPLNAITLQEACVKALETLPNEDELRFLVLPSVSPRSQIYMELEAETLRQEANAGEFLCDAVAENDPRDAITMFMEQLRLCAIAIAHPGQLVVELQRTSVLAVAIYQWSIKWFATLQKKPLDGPVEPRKIHVFSVPPGEIPEPTPMETEVERVVRIRKEHAAIARANEGRLGMPQGPCLCQDCAPERDGEKDSPLELAATCPVCGANAGDCIHTCNTEV